jgi:hypothetical protein
MMNKPLIDKRTKKFLDVLRDELTLLSNLFATHQSLLKESNGQEPRVHMMFPLLGSIISSSHCLAGMLVQGFLNEAYMIMRALYERCLNYCYLTCCPKEDFNSYFEHSLQKNIRALRKELVVAGFGFRIQLEGYEQIWDRPKVRKVLDEYSRRVSKKEIQNWSKVTKNRLERLEWISKNIEGIFWEPYVLVEVMIFEEASEALHGTFYGSVFHTGYLEPRIQRGRKWVKTDHRTLQLELLIGYAVLLHNSVVQSASHKYPNDQAIARSKSNVLRITDLMKETSSSVSLNEAVDAIGIMLPKEE